MKNKLFFALYALIVVCIGLATVIEKYHGTAFVSEHIYGAWWFSALWGVLTVASCACFIKKKLYKRFAIFLLHMAFVVILIGAFVTHLTASSDTIHLRVNQTYNLSPTNPITLKEFRIVNYPGTDAPMDYQSVLGFKVQGSRFLDEPSGKAERKVQLHRLCRMLPLCRSGTAADVHDILPASCGVAEFPDTRVQSAPLLVGVA